MANGRSPENDVAVFQCEPRGDCAQYDSLTAFPADWGASSVLFDEKNRRLVLVGGGAEGLGIVLMPIP